MFHVKHSSALRDIWLMGRAGPFAMQSSRSAGTCSRFDGLHQVDKLLARMNPCFCENALRVGPHGVLRHTAHRGHGQGGREPRPRDATDRNARQQPRSLQSRNRLQLRLQEPASLPKRLSRYPPSSHAAPPSLPTARTPPPMPTMSEDVTENTRNTREYTTWRNVPSRSGNSRNAVAVSGNRI